MSDRLITKKEMEVLHNILYDLKYNNFDFLLDYQKFNSSIRRFDFCMRDLKKFENIPEMEYHFKNKSQVFKFLFRFRNHIYSHKPHNRTAGFFCQDENSRKTIFRIYRWLKLRSKMHEDCWSSCFPSQEIRASWNLHHK